MRPRKLDCVSCDETETTRTPDDTAWLLIDGPFEFYGDEYPELDLCPECRREFAEMFLADNLPEHKQAAFEALQEAKEAGLTHMGEEIDDDED